MMQIPLQDGGVFAVIEPGNLARMKAGKPLHVGNVMIAFTPDMQEFMSLLGADGNLPSKGEAPREINIKPITPEHIEWALKTCQKLPEVER
jgi:hypothetical protein